MKYQLMHHTKGLVSYKSTQKLLVSLFDVFAARLFLTATMQALGARRSAKQQKDLNRGKEIVLETSEGHSHLLMHQSLQ